MMVIDWEQTWRTKEDIDEKRAAKGICGGHRCEGLNTFLSIGYSCTPKITEDGFVSACDDTNPVKIEYCPFCGTKL